MSLLNILNIFLIIFFIINHHKIIFINWNIITICFWTSWESDPTSGKKTRTKTRRNDQTCLETGLETSWEKYGTTSADSALTSYENATKIANDELDATHPIRLGLALNFSVFYYEVKEEPKEACAMAKKAFDDAIAELDNLDEEQYKDSTTIM